MIDSLTRRTGLTSVGLGAVVSAIALLGLSQALSSRAVGLLGLATLLSIAFAYVLGRRRLSLAGTRTELPPRLREGQLIGVTVSLSAQRRAGGLVLVEELPAALGGDRRLAIPLISPGADAELTYPLRPQRRGRYQVGPLHVEWQDPFGMTRRRLQVLATTDVVVHPRTETVADRVITRAWEDPPIRPPVSKPWPSGFEFYGLRDYVSGDDPRRIVWRATARSLDLETGQGRYLVAEAEQGITDRVRVLLDTDRSRYQDGSDVFETMVRTAASIASHHLDEGATVQVDAGADPFMRALRGRSSIVPLLDRFSEVSVGDRTLSDAAMAWLVDSSTRAMHGVIVTGDLDREAAQRLRLLIEQGAALLLVLVVGVDPDPGIQHRAGSLGCGVVEIHTDRPLTPAFRQVVSLRRS